jgi:hypothetical protein
VNSWEAGLDVYDGYAEARRLEKFLPHVPITYIWAIRQHLPAEWAPGAYPRTLRAWVRGLPDGRLVRCDCTHHIPVQHPEVAVEQVRILHDEMR